jgi:DNA-directed RNA polymerase specialized sigma24 family protein
MDFFKTSRQDDEQLIQQMKNGNSGALNTFFPKYFKKLKGFLRGIGSKDDDKNTNFATDAIIDFYRKYGIEGDFFDHNRGEVYTYLCQVVRFKFLKDIRDNKNIFVGNENIDIEDSDELDSYYDDLDAKAEDAFSKEISLELVIEFMRNGKCFSDRCLKLYSLDYKKMGLEDLDRSSQKLAFDYLEHEEKLKDETIALEMTRWSDKNEIPPTIFNVGLIRTTRSRCKESLKKCIREAGYVW